MAAGNKNTKTMDICNTCNLPFDDDERVHQYPVARDYLATLNDEGEIIQECCESCVRKHETRLLFGYDF